MYRRQFLKHSCFGVGCLLASGRSCAAIRLSSNLRRIGALQGPDANGVRLPPGFRSRIVARSGEPPVPGSGFRWHGSPDGAATFPRAGGGFYYVSNSELGGGEGGVGVLVFDRRFEVVDAFAILTGTNRNCAGGALARGTWLSCEEVPAGRVYECDPSGAAAAVVRPALGTFRHEAVAEDTDRNQLYLTEDEPDGRLYRFTPAALAADGHPDLSAGLLEVARVADGGEPTVSWHEIPDPDASGAPTRSQIPDSTAFRGGEGIAYRDGMVYFATKGDDRVYAYDVARGALRILYDDDFFAEPVLTGVDTIALGYGGEILVAEDPGDLQLVVLEPDGGARPLLQLIGHDASEVTGPAFDPSFQRLYFSSQRGTSGKLRTGGITFEITGPFLTSPAIPWLPLLTSS